MDRFALYVTVAYIAVSAAWITLSDQVVAALVPPSYSLMAQTLKGWAFVLASGGLIYLLVSREMRRRSRTECYLRAARDEARRADTTKAQFLAGMSHELRTPLNAINGYSEMMSREVLGPIGNPLYRQYAEIIHTSGRHLLALIEDLLDISRLDLDQLEIDRQPQRLDQIAAEACRLMRGRAEEKHLTLSYHRTPGDDMVIGDRVRLKQVLLNLIGNAVRYTRDGGVLVRLRPSGSEVIVEVADTGPGIEAEVLEVMRTPFGARGRRPSNAAVPTEAGVGLGLPLSHLLAERHGGRIEIDTGPDHGTTVRLVLPQLGAGAGTAATAE